MSMHDSYMISKAMGGSEHVCIGCGINYTTHPSMICNTCSRGRPSRKRTRKPRHFVPLSRDVFGDTGNDMVEDIIDAM